MCHIDPIEMLGVPTAPLPVTVDTREQEPYTFPPAYASVTVATVKLGDYAITGDESWAVERKGIGDLISSFVGKGEIKKLEKMRAAFDPDWPLVYVIDGPKSKVFSWKWERCPRATSQWFFSRLTEVAIKYQIIFDWNDNRRLASMMCLRWLKTRAKAIKKG